MTLYSIATLAAFGVVLIVVWLFNWLAERQRKHDAAEAHKAAAERARIRHIRSMQALADEAEWTSPKRGRRL
jgi:flagellar biosynthesis/type III secretory pathway M-ring protein FliF/YscJ